MIDCAVFDVVVSVGNREAARAIEVVFRTDLPCGTRVICDVSRSYTDWDGNECDWRLFGQVQDVIPVGPGDLNGNRFAIDIDTCDESALAEFNSQVGAYSKSIKGRVSDRITVRLTVGGRQPLKAFGRNNQYLTGGMVTNAGGINIVRQEREVSIEMQPRFQPAQPA